MDSTSLPDQAAQLGQDAQSLAAKLHDLSEQLAQQAQLAHSLLDLANLLFVQPARFVFAIARNERNSVASVEQLDNTFNARQRDL